MKSILTTEFKALFAGYLKVFTIYLVALLLITVTICLDKFVLNSNLNLTIIGPFVFKGILGILIALVPYYLANKGNLITPFIALGLVAPLTKINSLIHQKMYAFVSGKLSIEISSYEYLVPDPSGKFFHQFFVIIFFFISIIVIPIIIFNSRKKDTYSNQV
jgi:hypothetical protein